MRRRWMWAGGAVAGVLVLVVGFLIIRGSGKASPQPSPTAAIDLSQLAPPDTTAGGDPVNGISCDTSERVAYHIHAHLSVTVDGKSRIIPAGIGIPGRQEQQTSAGSSVSGGKCFYWLHSHTSDGIIHVESPTQKTFTLGDYFDIWKQPLDANHIGPVTGTLSIVVDGTAYTGDPRSIPLNNHTQIQISVGGPPPSSTPYTFPSGL